MITLHPLPEPKKRAAPNTYRRGNGKPQVGGRGSTPRDRNPKERHPCACRASDACS